MASVAEKELTFFDQLDLNSAKAATPEEREGLRKTPLPDLLPRDYNELVRMKKLHEEVAANGRRIVRPRVVDLPEPYVDDEGTDEFEDATINTDVDGLSKLEPQPGVFRYGTPTIEGKIEPLFDKVMMYKIITPDGTWAFFNDTAKYEMHVKFRVGSKSDIQPGEKVEVFVRDSDIEANLMILPGATEVLLSGRVNGFKCLAKVKQLSEEARRSRAEAAAKDIEKSIAAVEDASAPMEAQSLDDGSALEVCLKAGLPFVDMDFKPSASSLFRTGVDTNKVLPSAWMRPAKYIPPEHLSEVRLFRRTILPSHVLQGELGNSYVACALAILAEQPARIRDLFRHPVSAAQGKYERSLGAYWVTLNYGGWWSPVLIDDYLPANLSGPDFTRCAYDIRRLWPALLEKAYAKLHGSYSAIVSGETMDTLQELTGCPIWHFDDAWSVAKMGEDDDDSLFRTLQQYSATHTNLIALNTQRSDVHRRSSTSMLERSEGSDVMVTSSAHESLERKYKEMGLCTGYSYAVTKIMNFEEHDLRLVQIRNPWGTGQEWQGAWGRNCARWNSYPDVKRICFQMEEVETENSGLFWMDWNEALRTFSGGGVCFTRPMYDYRVRGEFNQGHPTVVLEINVSAKTEMFLTLSQDDDRGRTEDDESNEYAAMLLSVSHAHKENQKLDLSTSKDPMNPTHSLQFNFARELGLHYTFVQEKSPYYIIPRVHDAAATKLYTLGVLCDTYVGNGVNVEMKMLDRSCKVFMNMPSFVVKGMLQPASSETEYQIRDTRQPVERTGIEIMDDRLKEFGVQ